MLTSTATQHSTSCFIHFLSHMSTLLQHPQHKGHTHTQLSPPAHRSCSPCDAVNSDCRQHSTSCPWGCMPTIRAQRKHSACPTRPPLMLNTSTIHCLVPTPQPSQQVAPVGVLEALPCHFSDNSLTHLASPMVPYKNCWMLVTL